MKIILFLFHFLILFSSSLNKNIQIIEMKDTEETNIDVQKEEIIILTKIEKTGYLYFKVITSPSQSSIKYNIYNSTCYSINELPYDAQYTNLGNVTEKVEKGNIKYSFNVYVDKSQNDYSVIKIYGLKPNEKIKIITSFATNFFINMILVCIVIFFLLICCFCCCCCCYCCGFCSRRKTEKIE